MKKIITLRVAVLAIITLSLTLSYSQNVSINEDGTAPHNSAILDVKSSDKGVLFPRVEIYDATDPSPVTLPAEGLIIYNPGPPGGAKKGYYYWSGAAWEQFAKIDPSGVVTGSQIYGEMYQEYDQTGINYSIQTPAYIGWTSATQGNVTGTGYCTFQDNPTADRLVIETEGGGVYKVNVNIIFSASSQTTSVTFAVFKNGAEVGDLVAGAFAKTKNEEFSSVITGLIDLVNGDYIDLRMKSSWVTLTIHLVNFSIDRI